MKADIILSGVGGQGILSIAAVIGEAALKEGLYMKQAEVHGMSQRGGDVQSNLRLSDQPIASDLIPLGQADLIISLEPMEALRYLPYLKKDGWLVTNSQPFINIPNYPEMGKVNEELEKLPHKVVLDVEAIAKEVGSVRAANIVMLGAAAPFIGIEYDKIADVKAQDESGDLVKEGQQMPAFTIMNDNGTQVPSSSLKGKVILINFFATWCPPCQKELAEVQKILWPKYKDNKDFVLLVIGREHTDVELQKYNEKKGFTFPLYPDKNRAIYGAFAKNLIPRSYLVDKTGKVVYATKGYSDEEFAELMKRIEAALK